MSFKAGKEKCKAAHDFAEEVKTMLRPAGEVTHVPVEFHNAPALRHFGGGGEDEGGGGAGRSSGSIHGSGTSRSSSSISSSSSSSGALGRTWASLPGKKLKLDTNPLVLQARDGGGIDDASCLEVSEA
jgi:hypothetical protein